MSAFIAFFVQRGLLVNLISIFLLAMGGYVAFAKIQIEALPNVNLDIIQIDTGYPGASPKEVEQLVITPIEQELKALQGIDTMKSMSFPGTGRIIMEVDPDASNRDKLANEITLAIDRADLPSDLPNDPFVTEVDGAVIPIIRIAVSAPYDELTMKRLGDNIEDDLLAIKGVAQAYAQGSRKAEYRVTIRPEVLQRERLSVAEIARSIDSWNLNAPGGDLNTLEGQKSVRIVGEFSDIQDARDLVLRANERGDVLRLGDVAEVTETLEEPITLYDVSGESALSVLVLKKADADIIETVDLIYDYVDTIPDRYGSEISTSLFQDFSQFARVRLGVLTNNGLVGLVLVFITLLFFLRFSVAMTTTMGLPIVFMTGITLLYSYDVTLNLISMMGFIMVLGMLVDDAIIVGENITHHMEQRAHPLKAAIDGTVELIGPVTATILTTVAAFLPMMFMSGIIGKFVIAIPIVVITLLALSWLESFFILPSHVAHFTNANHHPPEKAWLRWIENVYGAVLRISIFRWWSRWTTLMFSFGVLLFALWLAGNKMSFQLFPPAGVDEFVVKVTAPPGTSLTTMRDHLRNIDRDLREVIAVEHLETTLAKSGDVSVDEGDPLTQRGDRYGQINVIYESAVLRPAHDALADMFAAREALTSKYPELNIAVTEIKPGPPVGRALEAEISSYDDAASERAARGLIAYLETIDGITTIDSGLKKGDDELHAVLDRKLATYAGVDLATAATHIRAAVGGLVVSTIRRGSEEIDVTIRFPEDSENELDTLKKLLIPNDRGGLVPLDKIATFEQHDGFTTIRHLEGVRITNVVADVDASVITSSALNSLVAENEALWQGDDVDKVKVSYGGEEAKNQESFVSLGIAFLFALVGIFFILAIQFNNLTYPLIVMLAIPFGAIGIIFAFYLHDLYWKPMPLSFFSTMGMVALTGVVVNSSLILLVFIQRARKQGVEMFDAIVMGGRRRIRAVLLTATTTVVGLLPTAYGWGGLDPFVSPMALALSWGLIFATLVTLITIPAALACGHDVRAGILCVVHKLFKPSADQT